MSHNSASVSRRKFLATAGLFAAGAATATTGIGLVTPAFSSPTTGPATQWPLPYVALDPEIVRKKGHLGYYQGKCSQGAFAAIVGELQEQVGGPYLAIPIQMMAFGSGGVAGWCTLCGAINGACAAIGLASKNYKPLCGELLTWYTQSPFPSDISNQYAVDHAFLVDKYKTDKALPQSIPGSPLCHINVTRWCKENNFASGSSERSERCARISGDVAAFAVELLNKDLEGTFAAAHSHSKAVSACRSCHAKGKDVATGGWARGKMECYDCHNLDTAKLVGSDHGSS